MTREDAYKLFVSITLTQLTGAISGGITVDAIPTWYVSLEKPFLTPPDWVFTPVWVTLYLLIGLSLFLVWRKETEKKSVSRAFTAFIIQLVLNASWAILFFGLLNIVAGFVCALLLWFSIAYMAYEFSKISRLAAWLLLPYFIWVGFATYLDFSIWMLNS